MTEDIDDDGEPRRKKNYTDADYEKVRENRLFKSHDLVLIKKFYYHFLIVMFIIDGAINDDHTEADLSICL